MHKMHSQEKLRCFGWDFGKCKMHSRQNAFLQILISRAEVRIQNFLDSDFSF